MKNFFVFLFTIMLLSGTIGCKEENQSTNIPISAKEMGLVLSKLNIPYIIYEDFLFFLDQDDIIKSPGITSFQLTKEKKTGTKEITTYFKTKDNPTFLYVTEKEKYNLDITKLKVGFTIYFDHKECSEIYSEELNELLNHGWVAKKYDKYTIIVSPNGEERGFNKVFNCSNGWILVRNYESWFNSNENNEFDQISSLIRYPGHDVNKNFLAGLKHEFIQTKQVHDFLSNGTRLTRNQNLFYIYFGGLRLSGGHDYMYLQDGKIYGVYHGSIDLLRDSEGNYFPETGYELEKKETEKKENEVLKFLGPGFNYVKTDNWLYISFDGIHVTDSFEHFILRDNKIYGVNDKNETTEVLQNRPKLPPRKQLREEKNLPDEFDENLDEIY